MPTPDQQSTQPPQKRSFYIMVSLLTSAAYVRLIILVRSHTTVPVPKVLAWNSNAANPIGAEYIIMAKVVGIQLFKVWEDINQLNRLNLIENLTRLEHQMSAIHFPVYGDLCFRHTIPEDSCVLLNANIDPTSSSCISRASDRSWYGNSNSVLAHSEDIGPCKSLRHIERRIVTQR